jgi:hypothetical protein
LRHAVSPNELPVCVELMTVAAERIVCVSPGPSAGPPVPVTAKLSKRFYEVLSEDVANELVECSTPWTSPTAPTLGS